MTNVLDAHALMVFLEKEKGFEKVLAVLTKALTSESEVLISSVNLGEVIYVVMRGRGMSEGEKIPGIVSGLPIQVVDVDMQIVTQAARYKSTRKMSYADCFAAALARIRDAQLLTGDPEFHEVEDEISISWL